jgi:uroporphyrinogen-III synthase
MSPAPAAPLAGRRVVVTRPLAQAAGLAQAIRAAGGEPLCVPAIEILPVEDTAAFDAVADRLETFDLAVFVSRNAVRCALELAGRRRGGKAWPPRLRVATVGQGSKAELEARGFARVIAPVEGADSEALLALAELAEVAGRRVVIFRGEGGRPLLADTLAARGARVELAACYRRARPAATGLAELWARGVDAVTVSSAEGLANFIDMLGEGALRRLQGVAVFVPHARVAQEAARLGLPRARVAGPGDAETVAGLVAYFGAAR